MAAVWHMVKRTPPVFDPPRNAAERASYTHPMRGWHLTHEAATKKKASSDTAWSERGREDVVGEDGCRQMSERGLRAVDNIHSANHYSPIPSQPQMGTIYSVAQ